MTADLIRIDFAARDLMEALEKVLSHERDIVFMFNRLGEGAPANFSLACEQAREVVRRVKGAP